MVFCFNCGTQLPDAAKFCSSCGTQLTGTSTPNLPSPPVLSPIASSGSPPIYQQTQDRSTIPSTPPVASTPTYAAYNPPTPQTGGSALLNAIGQPTQAFNNLAQALFNALDASVVPKNTHGMEVSKMTVYRQLAGHPIPPYFGEAVLPTYYSCIGAETVPGQPRTAPVLTWNGFNTFLLHKIKLEPDNTFVNFSSILSALGVRIPLQRGDFPSLPDGTAQMNENRFKREIYSAATQAGLAGGAGGGYGGHAGFGAGHAAHGNNSAQAMKLLAQTVKIGGAMMQNASSPGSGPWTFN